MQINNSAIQEQEYRLMLDNALETVLCKINRAVELAQNKGIEPLDGTYRFTGSSRLWEAKKELAAISQSGQKYDEWSLKSLHDLLLLASLDYDPIDQFDIWIFLNESTEILQSAVQQVTQDRLCEEQEKAVREVKLKANYNEVRPSRAERCIKNISLSRFGTLFYLQYGTDLFFVIKRRGLNAVFDLVFDYYRANVNPEAGGLHRVGMEDFIRKEPVLLNMFFECYFDSNQFGRDQFYSQDKLNPREESGLAILADILACIDFNIKATTASISFDASGIRTAINIYRPPQKRLLSFFSNKETSEFVTSLPLSNVKDFIANRKGVVFRLTDESLISYGNLNIDTHDYPFLLKENLVDWY